MRALTFTFLNVVQIKWICPTAPTRPVAILGGFPCTACKIISSMNKFWCINIRFISATLISLQLQHLDVDKYILNSYVIVKQGLKWESSQKMAQIIGRA